MKVKKKTTRKGGGCFVRLEGNRDHLYLSAEIRDFAKNFTNMAVEVEENALVLTPTLDKNEYLISKTTQGKTSICGWSFSKLVNIEENKRYYAKIENGQIYVDISKEIN